MTSKEIGSVIKNLPTNKSPGVPLKMGRRLEQTFSQRRHAGCHRVHEKMLNITDHQENANQNNSCHLTPGRPLPQETVPVSEDMEEGNLRWRELVQAPWKTELAYDPAIPLWGIYLKAMKSPTGKDSAPHVHCSTTYNSHDREAT